MHAFHRPFVAVLSFATVVAPLVLNPAVADAAPRHKGHRVARVAKKSQRCEKSPVEFVADCEGVAIPSAVDKLSILARPGSAARPQDVSAVVGKDRGADVAPGIRRIDPRLVERLESVVDHFRKEGQPTRVRVVSGYRPRSSGSYHASGRALDFRVEGVKDDVLVAYCKTLPDTGCGYYPNDNFVHMDVRDVGTGHVSWIDASRPGEPPRYVAAWPPADGADDDGSAVRGPETKDGDAKPADAADADAKLP